MEISIQAVALGILYQFLGIYSFQIGNVNQDSIINKLQKDNIRVTRWNKILPKPRVLVNNYERGKRFFEFNPVAFNKESLIIPVDENRRKHFHFSPFTTSLERIQTYSEQESMPKFKSTYITDGIKPKHLKPYVDHFSGVKSFALHLNNPMKPNSLDAAGNGGKIQDLARPVSGISMRAFLKPNRKTFTEKEVPSQNMENNVRLLTDQNILNDQTDNEPSGFEFERLPSSRLNKIPAAKLFQGEIKQHNHIPGNEVSGLSSEAALQFQTAENFDNLERFRHMPGSITDDIEDPNNNIGNYMETESKPYFGVDLGSANGFQAFDKKIESYDPVADAFEFGSFGNVIQPHENSYDSSVDNLGYFEENRPKPHFGVEEMPTDEFQTFEQGFGSFSSDNNNCENIDSKSCMKNSDCSCYGLYKCNKGKCTSTGVLAPGVDPDYTAVGHWHEEPVQFDTWSK